MASTTPSIVASIPQRPHYRAGYGHDIYIGERFVRFSASVVTHHERRDFYVARPHRTHIVEMECSECERLCPGTVLTRREFRGWGNRPARMLVFCSTSCKFEWEHSV